MKRLVHEQTLFDKLKDAQASAQVESEEFVDNEYDEESEWEQVDHKDVMDSDGFYTDYTLYYNPSTDTYGAVFGDRDIYRPEDGYFDAEFDNYQEAREWFDDYNGFEDSEDYDDTDMYY